MNNRTDLVWVDASAQLDTATEERFQSLLEGWYSCAPAHEHDVSDIGDAEACVLQNGRNRIDASEAINTKVKIKLLDSS